MLHFVIGDIHGCFEELLLLEDKIQRAAAREKRKFTVVSVGDLIDRGPQSKEVVQHFMDGKKLGHHQAVMGNHELDFIRYLRDEHSTWFQQNKLRAPSYSNSPSELYQSSRWAKSLTREEHPVLLKAFWLSQGGIETLQSYGVNLRGPCYKNLSPDHIKYLSQLPLFYEAKSFIVTHALPKKSDFDSVKKYFEGKVRLNKDIKKSCYSIFWNRDHHGVMGIGRKTLISGHTPYKNPRRALAGSVLQIDTHCFSGGKLTAYCPELNRFYSVKAKRKYHL
ncbi:MAG: hypothetical protein HOE90_22850 [Bacteriovoracaceae bacterium]|jgi:hypothetical protein|nr:hypothetical protein [Bacteriovoracaceae bacterium]